MDWDTKKLVSPATISQKWLWSFKKIAKTWNSTFSVSPAALLSKGVPKKQKNTINWPTIENPKKSFSPAAFLQRALTRQKNNQEAKTLDPKATPRKNHFVLGSLCINESENLEKYRPWKQPKIIFSCSLFAKIVAPTCITWHTQKSFSPAAFLRKRGSALFALRINTTPCIDIDLALDVENRI